MLATGSTEKLVDDRARLTVPGWLLAAGLLIVTLLIGPALGALSRPLFVAGCGAVGYYAWRQSAASHLQTALVLFCFVSFVRRYVDLTVGFDFSSIMLIGPLLAITVPGISLAGYFERKPFANLQIVPLVIVGFCVLYGSALTIFLGDFSNAASGTVKSIAPLIYGASVLMRAEDPDRMIEAATSVFLVILPLMGIYGIYQYVDPPDWDRYWMKYATILSAGQPLPYLIRTYSVMNGPASFATFTTVGLILVLFLRGGILPLILTAPAAIALLLSQYRTAWLVMAAAIGFCLLFAPTRQRAGFSILGIVAVIFIAMLTPFGDVITDRLATLGQGSDDGSARERLEQFTWLWNKPDSGLIGSGYSVVDVGSAGTVAVDGMIISCWLSMGIIVGLVCLSACVWAASNAIVAALSSEKRTGVVVGALGCGALVQMPLSGFLSGELAFLFWAFAVLLPASRTQVTGSDHW